jgi:DNA-binding transcriptional ArsR family regulator
VSEALRSLAGLDRTIHEPARLMIVSLLYLQKEADFLWLLEQTELTKGNLSAHLAKLEEAGYIEVDKRFRGKIPQTILRLTKSGRGGLDEYRRTLKKAMNAAG